MVLTDGTVQTNPFIVYNLVHVVGLEDDQTAPIGPHLTKH